MCVCMAVCVCVCVRAMPYTVQSVRSVRSVILSRGSVDSLKKLKKGLLIHWVHSQTHVSFRFVRVVCIVLCVAGDNAASVSISYPCQRPFLPSAESGSRHRVVWPRINRVHCRPSAESGLSAVLAAR